MKMENEVFKDIAGYEGIYQVSNLGRVKRFFKSGKEHLLRPSSNGFGYLFVALSKNGIVKYFKIHRLVAMAFIPNPGKLPEINHRDENKENNYVDNLEWCTRKYNNNYGTRMQKLRKQVDQYTLDGEFIRTWPSASQVGKELGIRSVCGCCKGKRKSAGGFVWKYHVAATEVERDDDIA